MGALGEYLKVRRAALGLTQRSLALRLGIAPGYMTMIEKGERRPSFKLIARIADTLRVDRQQLLFTAYPEAKEFVTQPNGTRPTKSSRSWRSFIKNGALLAHYQVSARELQTLASS